jgi:hypothetical protein
MQHGNRHTRHLEVRERPLQVPVQLRRKR